MRGGLRGFRSYSHRGFHCDPAAGFPSRAEVPGRLLTFSQEGIHFGRAHVDSQIQWSLYSRALVDAHSYVLYYGSRQFTVIPKRVFQSAEQQQIFEQLLTQHISEIVRRDT